MLRVLGGWTDRSALKRLELTGPYQMLLTGPGVVLLPRTRQLYTSNHLRRAPFDTLLIETVWYRFRPPRALLRREAQFPAVAEPERAYGRCGFAGGSNNTNPAAIRILNR